MGQFDSATSGGQSCLSPAQNDKGLLQAGKVPDLTPTLHNVDVQCATGVYGSTVRPLVKKRIESSKSLENFLKFLILNKFLILGGSFQKKNAIGFIIYTLSLGRRWPLAAHESLAKV